MDRPQAIASETKRQPGARMVHCRRPRAIAPYCTRVYIHAVCPPQAPEKWQLQVVRTGAIGSAC